MLSPQQLARKLPSGDQSKPNMSMKTPSSFSSKALFGQCSIDARKLYGACPWGAGHCTSHKQTMESPPLVGLVSVVGSIFRPQTLTQSRVYLETLDSMPYALSMQYMRHAPWVGASDRPSCYVRLSSRVEWSWTGLVRQVFDRLQVEVRKFVVPDIQIHKPGLGGAISSSYSPGCSESGAGNRPPLASASSASLSGRYSHSWFSRSLNGALQEPGAWESR